MKKNPELSRRAAADPARPGEQCQAPPGKWQPVIDHARCEAKDVCVVVCPYDVFEVQKIRAEDWAPLGWGAKLKVMVHGGKTAYAVNAGACRACGLCVGVCPEKAITLVKAAG